MKIRAVLAGVVFVVSSLSAQVSVAQSCQGLLMPPTPEIAAIVTLLCKVQSGEMPIDDPRTRTAVLGLGERLLASGQLAEVIEQGALYAQKAGKLPASVGPEKIHLLSQQLAGMVAAELAVRGATESGRKAGVKYESWNDLDARVSAEVRAVVKDPRAAGGFDSPFFIKEFERLTESRFVSGNTLEWLGDGPSAFARRREIRARASDHHFVLTWSLEDDETGNQAVQDFLGMKARGVKVYVIVDGQTAARPGYGANVAKLQAAGIPVILWRRNDPVYFAQGTHGKTESNGVELAGGSSNLANPYSHQGPPTAPKWRDKELYVRGPAVRVFEEYFTKFFNDAIVAGVGVDGAGKRLQPIALAPRSLEQRVALSTSAPSAEGRVAFVQHTPNEKKENILKAFLLAVESATPNDPIIAFNAYFIWHPSTLDALSRAKKRGVPVTIITNSAKSIDEPIIINPILKSANVALSLGLDVSLWNEDTYHAKGFIVGKRFAAIQSHNEHGRSIRWEREIFYGTTDPRVIAQALENLREDLSRATPLKAPIELAPNALADLAFKLFYDQM